MLLPRDFGYLMKTSAQRHGFAEFRLKRFVDRVEKSLKLGVQCHSLTPFVRREAVGTGVIS